MFEGWAIPEGGGEWRWSTGRRPKVLFLPDDRPHAPNEKIDIEQFEKGTRAVVRLIERLASPETT